MYLFGFAFNKKFKYSFNIFYYSVCVFFPYYSDILFLCLLLYILLMLIVAKNMFFGCLSVSIINNIK